MPETDNELRKQCEHFMRETLRDNSAHGNWDYAAIRPLPVYSSYHPGSHIKSDCSFGVKLIAHWAGVHDDPTGQNWTGYGNSDSIAAHLPHVAHARDLLVGDIVVYFGPGHAQMVLERGDNPLCWSDGHQGAPNTRRLSDDSRSRVFCRLLLPHHTMTPHEKLLAQSGYWSWLQWSLGEGDWKAFQPYAPGVRPNVPAKIDAEWWRRRKRFVAGRKSADPPTTHKH